jgi:hypothetical protein
MEWRRATRPFPDVESLPSRGRYRRGGLSKQSGGIPISRDLEPIVWEEYERGRMGNDVLKMQSVGMYAHQ